MVGSLGDWAAAVRVRVKMRVVRSFKRWDLGWWGAREGLQMVGGESNWILR